jgi:hypothetical protein
MTPCTQKLSAAKKKHFDKYVTFSSSSVLHAAHMLLSRGAKPVQLFAQGEQDEDEVSGEVSTEEQVTKDPIVESSEVKMDIDDDENPF